MNVKQDCVYNRVLVSITAGRGSQVRIWLYVYAMQELAIISGMLCLWHMKVELYSLPHVWQNFISRCKTSWGFWVGIMPGLLLAGINQSFHRGVRYSFKNHFANSTSQYVKKHFFYFLPCVVYIHLFSNARNCLVNLIWCEHVN